MPSRHEDRSSRPRVEYVQKRRRENPHMTVISCTGAAEIPRCGKLDLDPCLVVAQSWPRRPRPHAIEVRFTRSDEVSNKHIARALKGHIFTSVQARLGLCV